MSNEEKGQWVYLVVTVVTYSAYVVDRPRAGGPDRADGRRLRADPAGDDRRRHRAASIIGRIVVEIASRISARCRHDQGPEADVRDRDIGRFGEYFGPARVLGVGMVVPFILALTEADYFWIANAMYLAFAWRPSSAPSPSWSPIAGASRPMGKPTRVTQRHSPPAVRARRDDPGRARRAGRRHPPDDHRDRAGPLLAIPRDGLPDRRRPRRHARRRLRVPSHPRRQPDDHATTDTTEQAGGRLASPRFVIRAAWIDPPRHLSVHAAAAWACVRHTREDLGHDAARRRSGGRAAASGIAILGYYEDGPNLVTMAMNGWGEPEPAWWLNLQAHPDTTVELPDGRSRGPGSRRHRRRSGPACGSSGPIRRRGGARRSWASRRPGETAVVILEPREGPPPTV